MITLKREDFSQDLHGESYIYMDAYHASSSYEAIMPAQALNKIEEWDLRVETAYDVFQRIALVVEVVKADISLYGYASRGTRHLWQLVERGLVRVLEQISLQLSMSMVVPLPLARRVVPEWLRCMAHSVQRDTRDLVVFRETWRAATFFHKQLVGN